MRWLIILLFCLGYIYASKKRERSKRSFHSNEDALLVPLDEEPKEENSTKVSKSTKWNSSQKYGSEGSFENWIDLRQRLLASEKIKVKEGEEKKPVQLKYELFWETLGKDHAKDVHALLDKLDNYVEGVIARSRYDTNLPFTSHRLARHLLDSQSVRSLARSPNFLIAAPLLLEFYKGGGGQVVNARVEFLVEDVIGMQVGDEFTPPPTDAFMFLFKLLQKTSLSRDPFDCDLSVEKLLDTSRDHYRYLEEAKVALVPGKAKKDKQFIWRSIFDIEKGTCLIPGDKNEALATYPPSTFKTINDKMAIEIAKILRKTCHYGAFKSTGPMYGLKKVFGGKEKTDVSARIRGLLEVLHNVKIDQQKLHSICGFEG